MNYRSLSQAFLEARKDKSYPDVVYEARRDRDVIFTPQYEAAVNHADIFGKVPGIAERSITTHRRQV